jgi:O-antigen/teichoic acid export membrane protein
MGLALSFASGAAVGHQWIARNLLSQPEASAFIAVLAFAIPLMALSDLLGNIARGFGRALPYIVIRNLVPPICYATLLVLLSVWAGPKLGVAYAYVAAVTIGAATGVVLIFSLVRRHVGFVKPMLRLGPLYKYAAPIAMNSFVTIALIWVDVFLLAKLTDVKTVGIYRACSQIVIAFDLILSASSAASAPIYAVLVSEKRQRQLQETLTGATRIAAILAAPLMLVLVVNGGDILGLLGGDFELGRQALAVLAFGQFVKAVFGSASIMLVISNRQALEARNAAIAACLNFALNLALIPILGLVGAAIATALSLIALSGLRIWQLRSMLGLSLADGVLARILVISVPIAALVWGVSVMLGFGPGTGLIHLLARLAVMGLAIGGGLLLFCLNGHDRAAMIALLRRGRAGAAPP